MRIVCWNCNGLRTLRQYRPWYALKDWKECLDHLEADVICFQEAKVTKKDLIAQHRDMCLPPGYEAYYSLHPSKGYSGVVTFVKTEACLVQKAEPGLTGELVAERRDKSRCIGGYPDEKAIESPLYDVIDAEGRAVVVDCGLFVLFNLYCPNETDEGRRDYKMAFSYTLAERVANLIAIGREVIIVGDLNIAHLPIDHCKNVNRMTREEHLCEHPARRWLDNFLAPQGDFFDVTRHFHPTRKAMYTCWDTVKDTRPANYGARIDYSLVSKGLMKWVKSADIQANVYGSDHCPIYIDLHDEITGEDGSVLRLRDFVMADEKTKRRVPALATSAWPEFSGRRLQSFFTSAPQQAAGKETTAQSSPPAPPAKQESKSEDLLDGIVESKKKQEVGTKRKAEESHSPISSKRAPIATRAVGKTSAGQMNLKAFFNNKSTTVIDVDKELAPPAFDLQADPGPSSPSPHGKGDEDETTGASRVESALAWGSIFAPKEPPLCGFHREPARAWTVNKAGPNHGRKFWMCSRRVGGTNEASGSGEYRCQFWKWDSEVRNGAKKQDIGPDGGQKSFHEVAGRAAPLGSGEKRGSWAGKEESLSPHKAAFKPAK